MAKKKFNYESSMERITEISEVLEDGNTDLNESIKLYKEAMELAKDVSAYLNDSEKTVGILQKEMSEIFSVLEFDSES